jgi:uracil DNA glycosylase
MIRSIVAAYVAVGLCFIVWGGWQYRQSLKNIFRDYTLSSALAITGLLLFLLVPLWPLLALNWWQIETQKEVEDLRWSGQYDEVIETLRTGRPT